MKKTLLLIVAIVTAGAALGYGAAFWQFSHQYQVAKVAVAAPPQLLNQVGPAVIPPDPLVQQNPVPPVAPIHKPLPVSTYTPLPIGPHEHILMYHYVRVVDQKTDPEGYALSVTAETLDAQIAAMKAAGYTSMTMADFTAGKGDAKSVVMTFDDGYEDFYTTAYPILQKYGWTATIYIISGKIGGVYMTWDQLRELKAAGIEIGAHTVDHIDLATASIQQQQHQIDDSKRTLEENLGGPVISFCYPSGRYTAQTELLVKQAGFSTATTTHSGPLIRGEDVFALPRLRISPSVTIEKLLKLLAS